jgi:Dual specificity phosphatase, catalytic domain
MGNHLRSARGLLCTPARGASWQKKQTQIYAGPLHIRETTFPFLYCPNMLSIFPRVLAFPPQDQPTSSRVQHPTRERANMQCLMTKFFRPQGGGKVVAHEYLFQLEEARREKMETEERAREEARRAALRKLRAEERRKLREQAKLEKAARHAELQAQFERNQVGKHIIERLFLGSAAAAGNWEWFCEAGVTAVLNATSSVPNHFEGDLLERMCHQDENSNTSTTSESDASVGQGAINCSPATAETCSPALSSSLPHSSSSSSPSSSSSSPSSPPPSCSIAPMILADSLSTPSSPMDELPDGGASLPLRYHRVRAQDSADQDLLQYFEQCHCFMSEALQSGRCLFVHCREGLSRSPTLVISWLMRARAMSLHDAYEHVLERNYSLRLNDGFKRQLMHYEQLLRGDDQRSLDFFQVKRTRSRVQHYHPKSSPTAMRQRRVRADQKKSARKRKPRRKSGVRRAATAPFPSTGTLRKPALADERSAAAVVQPGTAVQAAASATLSRHSNGVSTRFSVRSPWQSVSDSAPPGAGGSAPHSPGRMTPSLRRTRSAPASPGELEAEHEGGVDPVVLANALRQYWVQSRLFNDGEDDDDEGGDVAAEASAAALAVVQHAAPRSPSAQRARADLAVSSDSRMDTAADPADARTHAGMDVSLTTAPAPAACPAKLGGLQCQATRAIVSSCAPSDSGASLAAGARERCDRDHGHDDMVMLTTAPTGGTVKLDEPHFPPSVLASKRKSPSPHKAATAHAPASSSRRSTPSKGDGERNQKVTKRARKKSTVAPPSRTILHYFFTNAKQ